jgi:enolase
MRSGVFFEQAEPPKGAEQMSEIKALSAREILDSRGNPTVEVEVETEKGFVGRASVPSGASTGKAEALELRDGDSRRFNGKGVLKAVANVENIIAPEIIGMDVADQCGIDQEICHLDGTPEKKALGANAALGVSLACARAASLELGLPLYRYLGGSNAKHLPVPLMNVFNGGLHSGAPCAFQEFMLHSPGAESFSQAIRRAWAVIHALRQILEERHWSLTVGDEGGFAPSQLKGGVRAVLELLTGAIEKANLTPGTDMSIAVDAAASSFYHDGIYDYSLFEENGPRLTPAEQIGFLRELTEEFCVDSIEDGLAEESWEEWQTLTAELGSRCQLVGDDLFVTSMARLRKGIQSRCANAILLKPNQIGTLTESCDAAFLARANGFRTIMSHRSGETCDPFIADLAVGLGTMQIKAGSLARGERIAKYNQLLRIEEQLGDTAIYGMI